MNRPSVRSSQALAVRVLATAALLLGVAGGASGQGTPSGAAVLRNFEGTFAGVNDFTATLEADVNMERVRIPKMTATIHFKRPDKVRYLSPNFAMLPKEGIALNPSALRDRYEARVQGVDTVEGRTTYRLLLTGKDPKTRLAQMMLWVDAAQWTPAKLETVPYGGRKVSVLFTYVRATETDWLPSQIVVSFQAGEEFGLPGQVPVPRDEQARSQPRTGTMTIRYTDYRINTGLSDDLFQPAEKPR